MTRAANDDCKALAFEDRDTAERLAAVTRTTTLNPTVAAYDCRRCGLIHVGNPAKGAAA